VQLLFFSLKAEGFSNFKSFFIGQISGIVEPIFGVLGALLVIIAKSILPYALSFAAGAMIYVVVEELIPESQNSKNTDIATIGTLFGFLIMMIFDVSFSSKKNILNYNNVSSLLKRGN